MNHVTAVYKTRAGAEEALRRMEAVGIADSQISILSSDETRGKAFGIEKSSKVDEGFTAGATVGGLVGAVVAGVLSAGAIAIPGINLVVSGFLISGLAGLGAGAATGGLIGALIGMGFEENEAKFYETELKEGNILLAVNALDSDQRKLVKEIIDETDSYSFNPQSMTGVRPDLKIRSARV